MVQLGVVLALALMCKTLESRFAPLLFGGDDLGILKPGDAVVELKRTIIPLDHLRLELAVLKLRDLPQITLVFHFLVFLQSVLDQFWILVKVASTNVPIYALAPLLLFSDLLECSQSSLGLKASVFVHCFGAVILWVDA